MTSFATNLTSKNQVGKKLISHLSFLSLAVLSLAVVACQTSQPITGPDGTEHQLIGCSAIEYCYQKATAVCAGPYKIINTNSEVSGSEGSTYTTVKLLVKCGK